MKKILTLIAVFAILTGYSQDCEVTAVGLHYVVPKGAQVDIMRSGQFQAGIGLVYNSFTTDKKEEDINYTLDILAYGGYRVYHKIERTAVYANIGYMMGNTLDAAFYKSLKFMLLRDQKAFSLESYHCRNFGVKIGIYLRI